MKKWVVTLYAEDGIYHKHFTELNKAIVYMDSQTGKESVLEEVNDVIKRVGYYSISDDWGRSIDLMHQHIGTCRVCKSKDKPLYTILINPKWHKVPNDYPIEVCTSCADDFECGGWTVEYSNGRHMVKKLEY